MSGFLTRAECRALRMTEKNGSCALEFRFSKPLLFYYVIMGERLSATVIIPC